jgi:DNA repair protein RecN (Recombination protein N)
MIRELKIKNFAIIDSLSIEFQPGLNIMSGETGAGKSIIVDALGLVLGDRAQNDQIKTGAEEAEVQAYFDTEANPLLEQLNIDAGDGIIVRRIISRTGKTRVYINDTLTNVKTLDELGRQLVDIHGQSDHQSLIFADEQMELVDSFGRHGDLLTRYRELYGEMKETDTALHELREKAKERVQRIDLLRFQIEEIQSADIKRGETAELEEERKILFNSTKLRELCEEAYALLHENEHAVVENLNTVLARLEALKEYDPAANESFELLESARPLISDSAGSLRDLKEKYNADPRRLDAVEKRLDVLRGLQKKYGDTEEEIAGYLGRIVLELETLVSADERIEDLARKVNDLSKKVVEIAGQLTEKRSSAAKKIQKLVTEKLSDLAFKHAVFKIEIEPVQDEAGNIMFGANGSDKIEFLFSANPSEPPKPLRKVASGGELSRVMLAVKTVFAEVDDIPVMVFDEIDAGIGGKAAQSVGSALKDLSKRHQVFCVTHLAQIASKAGAHFSVEKQSGAKKVGIEVKLLNREERIREIARMLSGEITPSSLRHSEELLKS